MNLVTFDIEIEGIRGRVALCPDGIVILEKKIKSDDHPLGEKTEVLLADRGGNPLALISHSFSDAVGRVNKALRTSK